MKRQVTKVLAFKYLASLLRNGDLKETVKNLYYTIRLTLSCASRCIYNSCKTIYSCKTIRKLGIHSSPD